MIFFKLRCYVELSMHRWWHHQSKHCQVNIRPVIVNCRTWMWAWISHAGAIAFISVRSWRAERSFSIQTQWMNTSHCSLHQLFGVCYSGNDRHLCDHYHWCKSFRCGLWFHIEKSLRTLSHQDLHLVMRSLVHTWVSISQDVEGLAHEFKLMHTPMPYCIVKSWLNYRLTLS